MLVCPVCRRPPQAWHVDPATLRCDNPDCATTFPRLDGGIPVLFDGSAPGSPEDELATTLYVRSHYLDRPNFITAICDGLLGHVAQPVANAVDLGCGVGGLAIELAHRTGAHVIGLDASPRALGWAARAAEHRAFSAPVRRSARRVELVEVTPTVAPAPGSVEWICADAGQPPLPAEAFDLVAAVNLLDAVANPSLVLAQASALLRPGGCLLVAQPDAWLSSGVEPDRWLADGPEEWDRALALASLRTVARMDGVEWTLHQTDRVRFSYTLHARLAVRELTP